MTAMLEGIGGQRNEVFGASANIKKATVNELVLNHDIIGYAKAELEKLNLGKVRVCERARKLRLKKMSTAVMDSVTVINNLDAGRRSPNNDQQHMEAAFERLRLKIASGGGHELVL